MSDIYLIDYSYVMYQYHFAKKNLSVTIDGKVYPTGGPYGVLKLISRIKEVSPEASIFCCVDSKPVARYSAYPSYKEGRKKQIDLWSVDHLTQKAAGKWGAAFVEAKGWEADDVIYTIVKRGRQVTPDNRFFIYSKDMDTIDLCDWNKVFQGFSIRNGKLIPIKKEDFLTAHGHPPESRQIWKALKGKPADNIKGIPRFRKKAAISICEKYMNNIEKFISDVNDGEVEGADAKASAEIAKHSNLVLMNCAVVKHIDVGDEMKLNFPPANESEEALDLLGMKSLMN